MPDLEPVHVGGPSAKGEAIGGAVTIVAQLKDWIMGILGDRAQSDRFSAAWRRKLSYIQSLQHDHPELGAYVTIYWRAYRGGEGETSRKFEDISVKTGTTKKDARESREPSALNLSGSPADTETEVRWIPPLKPLPLAEYHTPFPKIANATFAAWQWAELQDVSWGGKWGGAFNKDGTTRLDIPHGFRPEFAILRPPAWVYLGGYGQVDIDISNETTSDGYQVPVISDLDAALVFALDLETIKILAQGPGIRDTTGQLGHDFDLLRWVPVKDVQIAQALSDEVTWTEEAKQWLAFSRESQILINQIGRRSPVPSSGKDVLQFSDTGKEVTTDDLLAWARRNFPGASEDPRALKRCLDNIYYSHEFSGSQEARDGAAIELVVKLREEKSKTSTARKPGR